MNWLLGWARSAPGSKVVMAVTGVLLAGFLVGHMAGNLLVFGGPGALNAYAAWLKGSPLVLWGARIGLLGAFTLHVVTGLRLWRQNRAARPERYVRENTVQASFASRSMVLTGAVVGAFVVFHLLHFTLGAIQREHALLSDREGRHDVYAMVVLGFQNPLVSLAYVVALLLLALHLSHGLHSFAQSLGFRHRRYTACLETAAPIAAALLIIGFLAVPVSVLLGFVGLTP